jgi:hypothetical protein
MLTFSLNRRFEDLAPTAEFVSWKPKSKSSMDNWLELSIKVFKMDKVIDLEGYSWGISKNKLRDLNTTNKHLISVNNLELLINTLGLKDSLADDELSTLVDIFELLSELPQYETRLVDHSTQKEILNFLDKDEALSKSNDIFNLLSKFPQGDSNMLHALMLIYLGVPKDQNEIIFGSDVRIARDLNLGLRSALSTNEKATLAEEYRINRLKLKVLKQDALNRYKEALRTCSIPSDKTNAKNTYATEVTMLKERMVELDDWYNLARSKKLISWINLLKLHVHKYGLEVVIKEALSNQFIWSSLLNRWLESNQEYKAYKANPVVHDFIG